MPRLAMPPTPVSSTELKGQDGAQQLSSLQMSFELPPSAVGHRGSSRPSSAEATPKMSASSSQKPFPMQASETVKSRRRSSAAQKESFALPPPPTRSRKIIQMKPRPQQEPEEPPTPTKTPPSSAKGTAASGSKKKQPTASSAAGRKIARKTAHSLIERRRRSKMNEEFAVLKGLIPACTGEMHKLAILQVSQNAYRITRPIRLISHIKTGFDRIRPVPRRLRKPAQVPARSQFFGTNTNRVRPATYGT